MKALRPYDVTAITTSSVVEVTPAAYAGGTTYALGDQVSVFSGINSTVATMYESLQAGNTGHTPSSSPSWWQEIGTAYLAYNAGTAYSIDAIVTDTTNHLLYQSLANANTGNALTDTTKWLEIAPTNKWAPFDLKNGTQATRPLEVSYTITTSGRITTVAVLNIAASDLNVTVTDGVDEFYNEDISLLDSAGISDYWEWFFEPIVRRTEYQVSDLPNILNPVITVTLTAASGDVSLGNLVMGLPYDFGDSHYGAKVGNVDYSRVSTDDFGNTYVAAGSTAKRGSFTMMIDHWKSDQAFRVLDGFAGTPVLFIGADDYGSTIQFGLLKEWNIELSYPSHHLITIDTQALT